MTMLNYSDDPISMSELRTLLPDRPTIVELGAADGKGSLDFLQAFPGVRLFAFEPDPRNIEKHRLAVQDDRCRLFPLAAWSTDGVMPLHQSDGVSPRTGGDWSRGSSLLTPKDHTTVFPWSSFPTQVDVETIRLDRWAAETIPGEPVDLLWADIQGAEAEMLKGATDLLTRTRYLLLEITPRAQLYRGQPTLPRLRSLLPNWKPEGAYEIGKQFVCQTILLRNTSIP